MSEPRFTVASMGGEVGILDTQKNQIAIFHGGTAAELQRRLDYAERGLNAGTITTRDWVWTEYTQ